MLGKAVYSRTGQNIVLVVLTALATASAIGYRNQPRLKHAAGVKVLSTVDTPCEVGTLTVDPRANVTRRCRGDDWERVSWNETSKIVLGDRVLPTGAQPEPGLETIGASVYGPRMDLYSASFAWRLADGGLTIATKKVPESAELRERRLKLIRHSSLGRFGTEEFADDATDSGQLYVETRTSTIRVTGAHRREVAEFMAKQYSSDLK
jgi:hypothetical protein